MTEFADRMKLAKDLYFETRNKSQEDYIQVIFKFLEEYDDKLMERLDKYESDISNHYIKLRGVMQGMFNECLTDKQIKDNVKSTMVDFFIANKNEMINRITTKIKKQFDERERRNGTETDTKR